MKMNKYYETEKVICNYKLLLQRVIWGWLLLLCFTVYLVVCFKSGLYFSFDIFAHSLIWWLGFFFFLCVWDRVLLFSFWIPVFRSIDFFFLWSTCHYKKISCRRKYSKIGHKTHIWDEFAVDIRPPYNHGLLIICSNNCHSKY